MLFFLKSGLILPPLHLTLSLTLLAWITARVVSELRRLIDWTSKRAMWIVLRQSINLKLLATLLVFIALDYHWYELRFLFPGHRFGVSSILDELLFRKIELSFSWRIYWSLLQFWSHAHRVDISGLDLGTKLIIERYIWLRLLFEIKGYMLRTEDLVAEILIRIFLLSCDPILWETIPMNIGPTRTEHHFWLTSLNI